MPLRSKGWNCSATFPLACPSGMKATRAGLRQILLNLVDNAVKFTGSGEVRLSARVIHRHDGRSTLRILVKDTGIGIQIKRQAAVFESFTQADGSTSRVYGGTGLGLTICRSLARQMGGDLTLESEPGHGSTFRLELTLNDCQGTRTRHDEGSLRGQRVLIVASNASARAILRGQIEAWGCGVDEARDMLEAFSLLRSVRDKDRFTLILCDHQFHDPNQSPAKSLAADYKTANIPLILMVPSGAKPMESERGQRTVSKPVKLLALHKALIHALKEEVETSEPITPAVATVPAVTTSRRPQSKMFRVLLAEDNTTNQKVAMRMLERIGCHAEAVADGQEVLAMLDRFAFDLILMDLQMPELDGYATTIAIRRREGESSDHIPIVALTAHAMREDRERCLAAGMDDYLSKPITLKALTDVLARWRPEPGSPPPAPISRPAPTPGPSVDVFHSKRLQEISQGDLDFEDELLQCLLFDVDAGMTSLSEALEAADFNRFGAELHGLSGACRTIGANAMAALCRETENAAREPGFTPTPASLGDLLEQRDALRAAVTSYLASRS